MDEVSWLSKVRGERWQGDRTHTDTEYLCFSLRRIHDDDLDFMVSNVYFYLRRSLALG